MAADSKIQDDIKALAPGKGSMFTHIFNGAGNTTMLTAAVFALRALFKKKDSQNLILATTGISAVIGAAWGWYEGRQVEKFRAALTNEVTDLNNRIESLETDRNGWQEKIASKREQNAVEEPGVHQM